MARAKKPKIGRRALGTGRSVIVPVKVPPATRQDWHQWAEDAGTDVSKYVRDAVSERRAREVAARCEPAL